MSLQISDDGRTLAKNISDRLNLINDSLLIYSQRRYFSLSTSDSYAFQRRFLFIFRRLKASKPCTKDEN